MRVLVASNDLTFNPSLVFAYKARGLDVTAGISNFLLRLGNYDIVHLHWPEELVGYDCAHVGRTAEVLEVLDWWAKRAVIIATVHNLLPHSTASMEGPEAWYFKSFYERADLICHFSKHSRACYSETYPDLDRAFHIVHGLNDFAHLLHLARGYAASRNSFGLSLDQPVFSVVGALRKIEELNLVRHAWSFAKMRNASLIFASYPPWHTMKYVERKVDKLRHRRWVMKSRVRDLGGNIDDATLVRVVEASNAVIIPRSGNHLNSGILPLALTFGTPVVAPDYGVNSEVLNGTANLLYKSGNAHSLASALLRTSGMDVHSTREENLELARAHSWSIILDRIWDELVAAGTGKRIPAFTLNSQGGRRMT